MDLTGVTNIVEEESPLTPPPPLLLYPGAAAPPVVTLEEVNGSGLVLGCRSAGWFPRPQLSWWHAEGAPLPAVTIATTQDPDRLYNINSTVVVERSLSGHFTCRVDQEHFNQTRETEIHLPSRSCYIT